MRSHLNSSPVLLTLPFGHEVLLAVIVANLGQTPEKGWLSLGGDRFGSPRP